MSTVFSDAWADFVQSVESGVGDLAKNTVGDALEQAKYDADSFLQSSKDSLKRWGNALAQGLLDKNDFTFLIKGQSELAELHALQTVGVSLAKIERFRKGLLSLIVTSAFGAIGI